ncbi:MAG: molybdopterin molybdotransferase MoeA [Deltaproteobacteria bacterium]|nr:molybdopterin molybdotransferase MoeA [Deltaproteobacteria bacterium]
MKKFIGFKEALELTLASVPICATETLPLNQLTGRVLAEGIEAQVDCPSISTSRKDGFAVASKDLSAACHQNPVTLDLIGSLTAGDAVKLKIKSGQTVRVTTGAPLPDGADAVLSEEFCRSDKDKISALNTASAGRNIHLKGRDIHRGEAVAGKGEKLVPALIGLLAAAGHDSANVYKSPKLAVIATGDEVMLPGEPLSLGKLYASNMVEICAWLSMLGISYTTDLVPDRQEDIENAITKNLPEVDGFLTSGGAWGSERDLILGVLESLSWQGIYHRVRMGPGKPVGFGLLGNKPFFFLPGGPPSNEMAFLQLSIPALLKMRGDHAVLFPVASARLAETVYGKKDWTDFVHARLEYCNDQLIVHPARLKSGLQSMARKEALIIIPESRKELCSGEIVDIQLLVVEGYRHGRTQLAVTP